MSTNVVSIYQNLDDKHHVLNIGDNVLDTNGYVGVIKYIEIPAMMGARMIGIELNQQCPNGHDGTIDGKQYFKSEPGRGLFIKTDEIAIKLNNHHSTLNINDDTIHFPNSVSLKKMRKKEQKLLTFGYARDIKQYIPTDIVALCMQYNSYQPKINDKVQLKDGKNGHIWCIGKSQTTKKLYFGIKLLTSTRKPYTHFKTLQDITKIFVNDLEIKMGQIVTLTNDKTGRIKYIGNFDDIDQVIGIELNSDIAHNGHNGKGYFQCSIKGRGYFVDRTDIQPSHEQMLQQLPQHVKGCYSHHALTQIESTQIIRKLTSMERNPKIEEVIDSGVVSRLVQFLEFDDFDRLQFEAAWTLTNIASGTTENVAVVIQYGAVPIFVKLLKSPSDEVKEQAIWALGNIAGDSPEYRDLALSHGVLNNLLPICHINIHTQQQCTLLRNVSWALSNFCRGKPSIQWKYAELALKALSTMITCNDEEILSNACWTFLYLTSINKSDENEEEQIIKTMIENGSLNNLVKLLDHQSGYVQHPALTTIGNICSLGDESTQYTINYGVLNKLSNLIQNDNARIKRNVYWTISNITAISTDHIEAVITANLFPSIINALKTETYPISKDVLLAISNAISGGSDEQIKYLVKHGVIQSLCEFFKVNTDKKTILIALESIDNILRVGHKISYNGINQFAIYVEECDGINCLKQLQSTHSVSDEIHNNVKTIINTYFSVEFEDKVKEKEININISNQAPVPNRYICFKCKAVGKHWIMQCTEGSTN